MTVSAERCRDCEVAPSITVQKKGTSPEIKVKFLRKSNSKLGNKGTIPSQEENNIGTTSTIERCWSEFSKQKRLR